MDQKRLTLVREKGKDIPELVLISALDRCGAQVSVAFAHAPDGVPRIEVLDQPLADVDHKGGALGFVKDLLDLTKEHKILIHFSNTVDKASQPYTILVNEKDQPTLVATMIGDFSSNKETDGHAVEYVEAQEYLTPKILTLFEGVDMEIPKLMNKLAEPNICKELNKMGDGEFLNCTLLASNGGIQAYTRPKTPPLKYAWGFASSDLDEHKTKAPAETPKEKVDEPAKPVDKMAELKAKLAARAKGGATAEAGDKPAEPAAKPAAPASVPAVPQGDTAPATGNPLGDLKAKLLAKQGKAPIADTTSLQQKKAAEEAKESDAYRLVAIPETFSKERHKREWFAARGPSGEVNVDFPDWKTRKGQIVVKTSRLKELNQKLSMDEIQKRFPIASPADITRLQGGPLPAKATVAPAASAVAAHQKAVDDGLPIPTAHKVTLKEKLPGIVAQVNKKGHAIPDPDFFLKEMEDKHPSFFESLGLTQEETNWWKRKQYSDIGSWSVAALADAAFCEKMLRIKLQIELAKLKGEPLPGAQPQQDDTVAKPAAPVNKMDELKAKLAARAKAA